MKKILVLGVGNILLGDEGVGVRVVEKLESEFEFSDNVRVMDGGTLGIRLMDYIMECDYLVVVDAVLNKMPPGTVYRLIGDDLRKSMAFKDSMHQADLVETLTHCELIGSRPECVIIGVEPKEFAPWSEKLTPEVQVKIDELTEMVLSEVELAGGTYQSKDQTS
ncbi:HyaD/HybD family hydrogenase maturation endopeptidase [Desulfonatronovibrio hydrogenovorans]|uniref:HyaD/HybD family hydrogenase maturation endopeptidase n=1 Tax=Desulfonatronovibrio hydrogenovorans TaxID=53245 RepID=UPI000AAA5F99|nr:HyaD/HybD family hydrogenase maturation endopeptidase [Desulfonatronovibrio hydrogenovorans]